MNQLKFIVLLSILIILPLQNALGAGDAGLGGGHISDVYQVDMQAYYRDLLLLAQKVKDYARQYHLLYQGQISLKKILKQKYQPFQLTFEAKSYADTIKTTYELRNLGRQEVKEDMRAYISSSIQGHASIIDTYSRITAKIESHIENSIVGALSQSLLFIQDQILELYYPFIGDKFNNNVLNIDSDATHGADIQLVKLFLKIFGSVLKINLNKGVEEILSQEGPEMSNEYDRLINDLNFNSDHGWEEALFAFLTSEEKDQNIRIINIKAQKGTLLSDIFYIMSPEFESSLQSKSNGTEEL